MKSKDKLKKNEINKNSHSEKVHTINKIKENEKKFTIILVIIFMISFIFIGYSSINIKNKMVINNMKKYSTNNTFSSSYSIVTLTGDNIMADQAGLNLEPKVIGIENNTNREVKYRISFVSDDLLADECGCRNEMFDTSFIRFSIDGVEVKKFDNLDNMIIKEGILKKETSETVNVNMWLSTEIGSNIDSHFHGIFQIEQLDQSNQ